MIVRPVEYIRDHARHLKKNPLAIADFVLRYDAEGGPDLLALMATGGRLGYADLREWALGSDTSGHNDPTPIDDVQAFYALGMLKAGQPGPGPDYSEAADLFRALRRVRPGLEVPSFIDNLDAQTALMARRYDDVERMLPSLNVDDESRWMIDVDRLNPFERTELEEGAWLTVFNQVFLDAGLEPIELLRGAGVPFDRLHSSAISTTQSDEHPLVTIVMSLFKPDDSFRTSITSLLEQTWHNLQILVVDDCTPPGFESLIEEVVGLDDRIEYYRMPENGGTYRIRNSAMDRARGEFIGFQDADDWSHPRRIELQMRELLRSDEVVATMSRCLRVFPDLRTTKVGFSAFRPNASSLIFRAEQVKTALGGFDESRKGADTEFIERLRTVFGADAVSELDAPLALVQLTRGSLSRTDFRYRWHKPARRAYATAYGAFHDRIRDGQESAFLQPSGPRRFTAPDEFLGVKDPDSRRFDVVQVADWRGIANRYLGSTAEILALSEAGLKVGVAHAETPRYAQRRRIPFAPPIAERIDDGRLHWVFWEHDVHAGLILIDDPELLNFPRPPDGVALTADRVVIKASHPPRAPEFSWMTYDPRVVEQHARDLFGVEPSWLPAHAAIAAALTAEGATATIAEPYRSGVVETRRRSFDGPRAANRPVVGSAGIEVPDKDRPRLDLLKKLFPEDNRYDVRIRTSRAVVDAWGGNHCLPANWLILDDDADVFGQLDFFVGVPMRSWGPELSRAALEAAANGCVLILDPTYRDHFGAAALYARADDVPSLIDTLWQAPEAFVEQQANAYRFCEQHFSPRVFVALVTALADHLTKEKS